MQVFNMGVDLFVMLCRLIQSLSEQYPDDWEASSDDDDDDGDDIDAEEVRPSQVPPLHLDVQCT